MIRREAGHGVKVKRGSCRRRRPLRVGLLMVLFSLLTLADLSAQEGYAVIDQITVAGNRKTKNQIIFRELTFARGDTIPLSELVQELEQSENFIMNTGLFVSANLSFKSWNGTTNHVGVHIEVEEAWYLFPMPVFELADRNFNVWWVEQNRSLQRVNFGMEFAHLNFSGRMDKLKVTAKYGYTRKYSISYSRPYINRTNTLGLFGDISFSQNREINYATQENRQAFFRDQDQFVYERFKAESAITYRPGLRVYHSLVGRYHQNRISEKVATELNPNFFLGGRSLQRFFSFTYLFSYDSRDVRPYPMQGDFLQLIIEKDGIGIFPDRNALTFKAYYDHYFPFSKRWSMGVGAGSKVSLLRHRQPFNDYQALGFGRSNLAGYEYYVIDGLDMAYCKSSIRFEVLNNRLNFGKVVPIKAFRSMPVKLYLSARSDFGYVNDPFLADFNTLSNQLLWGGGLGIDLVLYYDKVIRLQYNVNHLLENGLFLHLNMNI